MSYRGALDMRGEDDLARDGANKRQRAETKLAAKKLIRRHGLAMKVVGIDYLDRSDEYDQLVVVYFTAPHRVDFRALVSDLARALNAKIDLRQVGSRDAARVLGGIGSCGRDLCCATFLKDFEPVSMRLAKTQGLPPNPMRISGACGRLMCCLKYEHPLYAEFNREAPKLGSAVETALGDGVVVGHRPAADAVVVRMNESGESMSCSRAGVCGSRAAFRSREESPAVAATETPADSGSSSSADTGADSVRQRKPRVRRRRSGSGGSDTAN